MVDFVPCTKCLERTASRVGQVIKEAPGKHKRAGALRELACMTENSTLKPGCISASCWCSLKS